MKQKILITGANGAFGLLAVLALLKSGHQVVATMREPDGRNADAAKTLRTAGATVVELDVTSDASVDTGAQQALAALGGLDVLVNVAGTGTHGLSEGFTAAQMLNLFDVNVVGVHRMMRSVLPTLRAQGSGLVINISSLLGRLAMPFFGPYSATKWAVESMSETYRAELSQCGVDVVLLEPGGFATSWVDNLIYPEDKTRLATYGELAQAPQQALQGFLDLLAIKPEQEPSLVATAIATLVDTPAGTRPVRTTVDLLGMAEPVASTNDLLAQVTATVYRAFGSEELLTLKVNPR